MKYIIVAFSLFSCFCCRAQEGSTFHIPDYDSVVMYSYSPIYHIAKIKMTQQKNNTEEGNCTDIIDKHGKLNTAVKKAIRLSDKQANELNERLTRKDAYNNNMALCFSPHLAFVYYRAKKPAAYIEVCMGCNILKSDAFIPANSEGMSDPLRAYFSELSGQYQFIAD